MDWKLFAQLVATLLVAVGGWWAGHLLTSRRDLLNEQRKLRVGYLVDAYRTLEGVTRSSLVDLSPKIETALAEIQLLGSARQAQLARDYIDEIATKKTANLDDLMHDLRDSLRRELKLEPVSERLRYLRIDKLNPPKT